MIFSSQLVHNPLTTALSTPGLSAADSTKSLGEIFLKMYTTKSLGEMFLKMYTTDIFLNGI